MARPNIPADRVLRCGGARSLRAGLKNNPRLALITGHAPYGLHHFTSRKVEYITFLRDPIDRAISHYYFIREAHDPPRYTHPLYEYASSVSLLEFYRNRAHQNRQTRFLAGFAAHRIYDRVSSAAVEKAILNRAIKNLRYRYVCFGLQNRFNDSIALFQSKFDWPEVVKAERHKKTEKRLRVEDLDDETLQALRECNALDTKLYEFAQAQFDKMFEKLTVD